MSTGARLLLLSGDPGEAISLYACFLTFEKWGNKRCPSQDSWGGLEPEEKGCSSHTVAHPLCWAEPGSFQISAAAVVTYYYQQGEGTLATETLRGRRGLRQATFPRRHR